MARRLEVKMGKGGALNMRAAMTATTTIAVAVGVLRRPRRKKMPKEATENIRRWCHQEQD